MERFITYLREVRVELQKVNWPTRTQTAQYTLAVILVSVAVALFLGALDFVFVKILNTFIL